MTISTTAQRFFLQADAPFCLPASLLLSLACLPAVAIAGTVQDPLPVVLFFIIAPFAEETLFRAGVQEWFHHLGWQAGLANLTTSLLFVAAHCLSRGASAETLGVLLPSLFLGWLYGRYRSLRACIAAHVLMNVVWWSLLHWTGSPFS